MEQQQCWGCGFTFPSIQEPSHRYGVASAGCWNTFNELLVQEANFFKGYPSIHRLTVDAYCVQHPPHFEIQKQLGISERFIDASIQSIAIHLIALYAIFEKKVELEKVAPLMDRVLSSGVIFKNLEAPSSFDVVAMVDIQKSDTAQQYSELVWRWGQESWAAWKKHHSQVHDWFKLYAQ